MIYAYQKQTQPRKKVLSRIFGFLKRKKAVLALVLAITAATSSYYVFGLRTQKAEAAWWDDTWRYRKAVNITNSSGSTLTDFQVSFTLDTASLISAGKMQADCDDIRITDSGGNLIPHWIEENNPGCNNSATKIWTKVPSIPTSGATIYVYYGNSSAGNVEGGDNVFEFFDDFNDGVIDNQKWTIGNSGTGSNSESSGVLTITSSGDWWGISDNSRYLVSTYACGNSCIVESKVNNFRATGFGRFFGIRSDSNTNAKMFVLLGDGDGSHITNVFRDSVGGSAGWYGENSGISNPGIGKIAKFIVNGDTVTSYYNNSQTNSRTVSGWGLQYVSLTDTENFGSQFDWVFVRKYASTEPSASVSSLEQQRPQGPVAYWKFDEGYGTTTYDSTGTNNGTISGASWQTEDLCMTGKCLKFDGTDDYVGIGSTANEIKTVSFWVKPNTTSTYLLALNGSAYISASSGTISATGFTNPTIYVNGKQSTTLVANQWQHIVVTTNTGITASAITLGKVSSNYLQGFLDEVKLYNFARTANQIKADYNAGKAKVGSAKGAAVVMGSPEGGVNLSEGLVGYWKMDEASWNGTSGEVIDSSGNGNNGTTAGGTTTGAGKFGNGGSFDGNNDYVEIADNSIFNTSQITICAWIKASSFTSYGQIIAKSYNTYYEDFGLITNASGQWSFQQYNVGPWVGNLTTNTWYHLCGVADSQKQYFYQNGILLSSVSSGGNYYNSNYPIGIGATKYSGSWSRFFNGLIDEVRIYNRALSPAEVRALYEWAPGPVAHFKLDDGNGTSPVDSSGFGRIGSIVNGIWSVGKFGKGIKLDGSGDYIQINDF